MHDKSAQREIDTQKNDHSWQLENISHDTTAVLCICTHTHTLRHTSYIMDTAHPPQLFSLSQHQSSWCVTAAVGYCVTMWVLVCENEYGLAGFSPISCAGLGVSGVSMASGFPEPKPLFLGKLPHLSPLTCAISLSLAHIQIQECEGMSHCKYVCICVTSDKLISCHVVCSFWQVSTSTLKANVSLCNLVYERY